MGTREQPLMQLCATPLAGVAHVIGVVQPSEPSRTAHTLTLAATEHGDLTARQAASCLLAPEVGDTVWFAGDLLHGVFVTAVLQRQAGAPARLTLPADTRIEAAGTLGLQADAMHWATGSLQVQAREATLAVGEVTAVGTRATWSFASVKLVADLFEGFVDRCLQVCRWSQRTVDGMEQLRCRQLDYQAEQLMQLQAGTLVANADTVVKLDGPQIHVG